MSNNKVNRAQFLAFLGKYDLLVVAVRNFYADLVASKTPNHGHALDHDLLVASYCLMIMPDGKEREGELAAVAGLLHSMDRHFKTELAVGDKIGSLMALLPESVTAQERELILQAVADHSKKDAPPSDVTYALQDADKLANNGFLNLIRNGQHHPHLPAILLDYVDKYDPACGFKADKRTNCFGLLKFNLEWMDMLHFAKSHEIAGLPFSIAGTLYAQQMVIEQFRHAGLIEDPAGQQEDGQS